MSPRTVERVDDWESVPFGGGYGGLRDLASQEFSGVVTAGPSRLFMIRGTVVGILDGSIDDFEDAGGTARRAPHPALPLLAVMQERSDEVRAQYYTEETPIADVNRTLEDGGFTGYVELSENVLSGDYYQVYHQGRSMSVAYVGSSERLITDDDAFEQANDEVGIYEVRPVEVAAIDVPEPTDTDDEEPEAETSPSSASTVPDEDAATSPSSKSVEESGVDASSEDERSAGGSSADEGSVAGSEPDEDDVGATEDRVSPGEEDGGSESVASSTAASSPGDDTADPATEREPNATAESTNQPASESADSSEAVDSGRTRDGGQSGTRSTSTHPGAGAGSDRSQERDRSRQRSDGSDTGPAQARSNAETERGQANVTESTESPQSADAGRTAREPSSTGSSEQAGQASSPDSAQGSDGSASAGSAGDLETRSIPSLDPSRTEAASKTEQRRQSKSQPGGTGASQQRASSTQTPSDQATQARPAEANRGAQQRSERTSDEHPGKQPTQQSTQQPSGGEQAPGQAASTSGTATADRRSADEQPTESDSPSTGTADDLQTELAERERELEDLRTDLERVEAERDELESAHSELEAERDRLQSELEESRAEIERLEDRLEDFADEGAVDAETQLSAGEAVDNTNLFVRYRSKGDATLKTAHAGDADRAAVAENLRLEYHTQFDADTAAVGNEPFDDFLTDTISYRFVEWIIENLLYEIRDTGHADAMADLYNALPKIDRAELNGQVSVTYTEDGEEHRSQERFDIVVRDRMGNPLIVANINDSRDPATDAMMTDLVKRAERVGESSESLAGAFLVTASFFEPEALETADEATSSGLFSRDKRKSFVNLSRKGGYHLCLVEARNREFHLAVPEL